MTYEELASLLRKNQFAYSGVTPSSIVAPSVNDIISGIQSQYQPVDLGSYNQPYSGGASRYITGEPSFGDVEQVPEYGTLNQMIGPSFLPSAFNKDLYTGINSQKLSDLISTISTTPNDYGGDGAGTSGTSVDDAGLATSTNIGTMGVTGIAAALGAMTGLPVGLAANVIGKQAIANAINAQSHAQAVAFNNALVANQLGIANSSQNAAALAAAIDSLSAANPASQAAVSAAQAAQGISGISGGAAANAAANAAAAAAAAGHSDAAIGAASQAAANAAVSGLSASAQAQAASDAAASVDGGTTGPGSAVGIGVGSTTGINAMDAQSDAASAAAAAAAAGVAAADGVGADGIGVGGIGSGDAGTSAGGDGTGSGADGGSSGDCVDPAVLIMLGDKTYVPAGSIKVGDVLFAMHEKTQEFGIYPVEHSEEVQQPKAIVSFSDGSTMTTSHSHKFFMVDGSWKQVYQLEQSDVVKAAPNEADKTVQSIEDIGVGSVMKITVSDAHTYISEGLISHNMKAKGGIIRRKHMVGPNPQGADDGYVALDVGEYVIKKSSVDKYGESLLSLINEGKVSKKKLQSLI